MTSDQLAMKAVSAGAATIRTGHEDTVALRGRLRAWAGAFRAGAAQAWYGRVPTRPVLITNPRSGTHYLKQLIALSLGRPAVEREFATARELKAGLAAAGNGQLVYGHFPVREFAGALDPGKQPDIRLILLTRHPIDRLISQLAMTQAQGGRLPDATSTPQQLARELLLGHWDGRKWTDGFVTANYSVLHNFYLHQLHTGWLGLPHTLTVKFEDLVADPEASLARVLGFLGADISARRIRIATTKVNFASLSGGRRPGQADAASHYRQGLSGEWRQVFSAEDIERMRPNYADAFRASGYEL